MIVLKNPKDNVIGNLSHRKQKKQRQSVTSSSSNLFSDWLAFGYNLVFEPHVNGNQHIVCCSQGTQQKTQHEYKWIYRFGYILCLRTKLQWNENEYVSIEKIALVRTCISNKQIQVRIKSYHCLNLISDNEKNFLNLIWYIDNHSTFAHYRT